MLCFIQDLEGKASSLQVIGKAKQIFSKNREVYYKLYSSPIYKYIKIYKSGRSYGRFMEFGKMAFGKKICAPRQSLDG